MAVDDSSTAPTSLASEAEVAEQQECTQAVAGCFARPAHGCFPVWQMPVALYAAGRYFGKQAATRRLVLGVALPERRLRELRRRLGDEHGAALDHHAAFRRVTLLLDGWARAADGAFNLRHVLGPQACGLQMLIRWRGVARCSREQLRARLDELRALLEAMGRHGGGVPDHGNVAVCATVPWSDYAAWARAPGASPALALLAELGVVAAVPVRLTRADGRPERDVARWCPESIVTDGERREVRRGVAAAVHEVRNAARAADGRRSG